MRRASSDKRQWQCWMEGQCEVQRDNEKFSTPYSVSAFGFGKTQEAARLMAYGSCSSHMSSLIIINSTVHQARRKTECHATQCVPL
jgi:hypothetical protein